MIKLAMYSYIYCWLEEFIDNNYAIDLRFINHDKSNYWFIIACYSTYLSLLCIHHQYSQDFVLNISTLKLTVGTPTNMQILSFDIKFYEKIKIIFQNIVKYNVAWFSFLFLQICLNMMLSYLIYDEISSKFYTSWRIMLYNEIWKHYIIILISCNSILRIWYAIQNLLSCSSDNELVATNFKTCQN